jgi:NAD(P)-dependent dehydrogenase (short-subunit alcohol dehydrogenase family)
MALEWSLDNIRVNAIAPGYFSTEMNEGFLGTAKGKEMLAGVPMRRAGESGELEGPLLLLASGASSYTSSYMTGSVITVDGGHLCRTL